MGFSKGPVTKVEVRIAKSIKPMNSTLRTRGNGTDNSRKARKENQSIVKIVRKL